MHKTDLTKLTNVTASLLLLSSLSLSLLLLTEVGSAKYGESDIHPISPKPPAPQYHHIDRKKGKGKI